MLKKISRDVLNEVAIATATFYNPDSESDKVRMELAKDALRKASDFGYRVVIVDGGSPEELLKEFQRYEGITVNHKPARGIGERKRDAVEEVCKLPDLSVVVYTDAEKVNYVSEIEKTAIPILEGKTDAVIPSRISLDSYPIIQQFAEQTGNMFWKELTGKNLDMWFGPRTFNRQVSSFFTSYDGAYGDTWDSIFIPFLNALHNGKGFLDVKVDYTHPQEQSQVEDDLLFSQKRIKQLYHITKGLKQHLDKIKK